MNNTETLASIRRARRRSELAAWARAALFTLSGVLVLALLVLAGLSTIGGQ